MRDDLPYAEDLSYFKTSKSNAGSWLDKTEALIEKHGGSVLLRAKGKNLESSAFLVEFVFEADRFRAVWPVLPSKYEGKDSDPIFIRAAERQAATMLHHDCKARCMKVAIFGARLAFFDFLLLDDGRTAGQLSTPELADHTPVALLGNG